MSSGSPCLCETTLYANSGNDCLLCTVKGSNGKKRVIHGNPLDTGDFSTWVWSFSCLLAVAFLGALDAPLCVFLCISRCISPVGSCLSRSTKIKSIMQWNVMMIGSFFPLDLGTFSSELFCWSVMNAGSCESVIGAWIRNRPSSHERTSHPGTVGGWDKFN